ncbi:MAG: apolipoprotein N-acyltransferase, partial [Desulfuromonadales bacterium]|nr:apolipoprotein N-acyltransferase [Desulfuromonadales bacterium]
MKYLPDRSILWALAAGVVLALSFPRPDLSPLAWIGLVPLLLVMHRRPFATGFAAGVGFFSLVLYWLNIVMTTYGQMHPIFSVVAYLLLVGYLALFFAVATWTACQLQARRALPLLLTLPVVWVGLEFLRSFLLSGFPWALLGYSQQNREVLLQSADLFGVYGLSFLIVLVNVALADLLRWLRHRQGGAPWLGAAVAAGLIAATAGYGLVRLGGD